MASEEDSASSSVPTAVLSQDSQDDESEESAEQVAYKTGIPIEEVVDHSHDEDAEAKSLELKKQGNDELIAGHYLKAVKLYSEALEYTPTNAILLANRAQAYIKVENYGLAIIDATAAIKHDPSYAKGYYRRASAYFALNKYKLARKDFRKVCQLKPKDRDARAKLAGCEKAVREEAFSKAIVSEKTEPLSSTYNPDLVVIDAGYHGPNPLPSGPMTDMDAEKVLFLPGKLPMDFVMVSFCHAESCLVVSSSWKRHYIISYIHLTLTASSSYNLFRLRYSTSKTAR
jgi:tetratricopeptide (TPR) repeat protein